MIMQNHSKYTTWYEIVILETVNAEKIASHCLTQTSSSRPGGRVGIKQVTDLRSVFSLPVIATQRVIHSYGGIKFNFKKIIMEQKDLGKKSYDLYFINRVYAPIRDF